MVSHVVVGASRGIGYQLLKHFSQDPADTVVGLARDATKVQEKARKDGLQNVIILGADMTDYDTLLKAAEETRKVTDGSVDYLWNNGGHMGYVTIGKFFSDFEPEQYGELLKDLRQNFETNVIGVINAINAFLPLVKKSSIKKVITLTTGLSDNNLTRDYGIWEHAPYAVGKAAVNTVVAKYDARYRSEGILFLGVSPGLVQTGGACTYCDKLCQITLTCSSS